LPNGGGAIGQSVRVGTDSDGRPILRYTVRLLVASPLPQGGLNASSWRHVEFRAVTSLGEHKAAAMAALRQQGIDPSTRLRSVEVIAVEDQFVIDPDGDLLDYWGGCD
jgi:hypothetical protein